MRPTRNTATAQAGPTGEGDTGGRSHFRPVSPGGWHVGSDRRMHREGWAQAEPGRHAGLLELNDDFSEKLTKILTRRIGDPTLSQQYDLFPENITKEQTMATETKAKALDRLFEDFFRCAFNTFEALEIQYGINGVRDQIFGKDADETEAKKELHGSPAWKTLLALYDYAVNGVEPGIEHEGPRSLVLSASDVLKLASSEDWWPSDEWRNLIAMGDGRFALDEGMPVPLYEVALLANVDVRTVRNAISSGELISFKNEDNGDVYIENAPARRWLHGRRGFKQTVKSEDALDLECIATPAEFGALLKAQRSRTDTAGPDVKPTVSHPSVTTEALSQLEAGIFTLPLDAVLPVSDFYLLDRKEFLRCVMRVFFCEELQLLSDTVSGKTKG